ncbi:MAG: thiol reductant ABC exporter subunit CydD [Mycobacteriaceae bacterium]
MSERRTPIDPRLWQYSRSARVYLVLMVFLGVVTAITVVVIAVMTASILAGVITQPDRRSLADWTPQLYILLAALTIRVAATWMQVRFSHRSASYIIAELADSALRQVSSADLRTIVSRRDEVITVLLRGLEDLRPYLMGYLPALVLAGVVTPITVLAIACQDIASAVIITVTLPLIPIFMVLIGLLTKGKTESKLLDIQRLSSQFLDLIAGLPTLRALGRQWGPAARIHELGQANRRSTMAALRIAFLSAMVLELLATLSVALVAVGIGLRLVFGDMELASGIAALILAPEVYLPLRVVGAQFHAAQDGLLAADKAFNTITLPALPQGEQKEGLSESVTIELQSLCVESRKGAAPYLLSAKMCPGELTVLTGCNGSGKTTAMLALLGLVSATGGIYINGSSLTSFEKNYWWSTLAWLPQHPTLLAGTLEENLKLGSRVDLTDSKLAVAAEATGFSAVLEKLPQSWETHIGNGGVGLSLGQRQRFALTRLLLSSAPVILADEPTAHLDPHSEKQVLAQLVQLARSGRTVVVIAHRDSVLDVADRVIQVKSRGVIDDN